MKFNFTHISILLFVFFMRGLIVSAEFCPDDAEKNMRHRIATEEENDKKKCSDNETNKEKNDNLNKKDKDSDEEKSLKIGNLSLPTSQQPGPLVGFGENISSNGVVQLFLLADDYQRRNGHFIDLVPAVLWGVNDQFSIFYNVPVAPSYKDRKHGSSGLADLFVQFEYAFYTREKQWYIDQATIVFNVTFPTGSSHVVPPTGFGAPTCFIGTTYNHTAIDWFYFCSVGSVLTSATKHCTKLGSQLLYEFGFGRNIASPKGWIYAWMFEFDGEYSYRNRICGTIDSNSGGNVIFMTPSLWVSNKKLIFQLGFGCPIYQQLYGSQIKYLYQVIFNAGYTF